MNLLVITSKICNLFSSWDRIHFHRQHSACELLSACQQSLQEHVLWSSVDRLELCMLLCWAVRPQVSLHLEAQHLFWCNSRPEVLHLLKSNAYFFLKAFICISGLKKPQQFSVSRSDVMQCVPILLNYFSESRVVLFLRAAATPPNCQACPHEVWSLLTARLPPARAPAGCIHC